LHFAKQPSFSLSLSISLSPISSITSTHINQKTNLLVEGFLIIIKDDSTRSKLMCSIFYLDNTIVVVSFSQSRTSRRVRNKESRVFSTQTWQRPPLAKLKKKKRTHEYVVEIYFERELCFKTFIKLFMHHHSCKWDGHSFKPFCLKFSSKSLFPKRDTRLVRVFLCLNLIWFNLILNAFKINLPKHMCSGKLIYYWAVINVL
jgi:hypothetical protein